MKYEKGTCAARPFYFCLAACGLLVLAQSCAKSGPPQLNYREIEVKHGGSISGVVRFDGPKPAADPILADKDQDVCGASHPNPAAPGSGDGIRGAIVYLDTITAGKPFDLPTASNLAIGGCEYGPHVQVVKAGANITVANADRAAHTTHFWLDVKTMGVISQLAGASPEDITLNVPGLYTVRCELHSWMRAFVMAAEHPYYAVTDSNGRYALANVPPGKYTLKVWRDSWTIDQPTHGSEREYDWRSDYRDQKQVEVASDAIDTIDFSLH